MLEHLRDLLAHQTWAYADHKVTKSKGSAPSS
jgi:hypothetical protein